MKKFYLRIILPTILSILLFILTIFLIIIPRFQQNIMDGKREMIKELTNSALSILSKYENDEKDSLLTREEAQKTAISRIQYLRYGDEGKDYFWITDITPKMIMHPFRTDLNGKDLSDFKDPHGKKMFVEFVTVVQKSESGYVDYMWQWKDDSLHIVPKLSYVKIFKPWNWVIGTGIYIEDAKKEIAQLTNRLLWISGGISILLALLLFYILKQSLNIERKRISAENELHKSKEKFRTLVDAATEGLIMLIDGKISFSNIVMSKITGFESSELLNLSLNEIISKNNNVDIINTFSKNTLKDGQYELNLTRKNGGFAEVFVTSSTTVFYGKEVNIIIVRDISTDRQQGIPNIEYQKLISTLNIGFFKADLSGKGTFIFANETALRILGYDSFDDLLKTNIPGLISEAADRKSLRKNLADQGFVKNKVIKIIRKNGDISIVLVSLLALSNEARGELTCDGIIEDITLPESEKRQNQKLVAELKANDILMEQPVKEYLTEINTLDADSTISDAIQHISKKKIDCVFLTNKKKDLLGIITNSDIQKRVLNLNLNLDNPAYLIMSSPIEYISETDLVGYTLGVSNEKGIKHLLAKNSAGEITGLLNINTIYQMSVNSLAFYLKNVEKAESTDDLKQCYNDLLLLVKPLIHSEVSVKLITNITAAFSDAVIKRIIELTIDQIGLPPARFSFMCMGSEGRKEETLLTDQDNAIVYEDVSKEQELAVNAYFMAMGEKVCNALNGIGYAFCKGNIMAKNQQWCKPLSAWANYFRNWIGTPDAQNLLDATIFFDFRCVYGDESLTKSLADTISVSINENPSFVYHLANNTYNIKPPHISSGSLLLDKHDDSLELKSAMIPIIMFARTYAFQNGIWYPNTIDRLTALKERKIISENTIDEIIFAYNFLMKLRLRNQLQLIESKLMASNIINTKKLIDIELFILKKLLTLLPDYQNKIKLDFRIST